MSGGLGRALTQTSAPPLQRLAPDAEVEREFGGRWLADYTKKCLLGRGACGAVWLATSDRHRGPVAVKQVAKGSGSKQSADLRSATKEIDVGGMLFGPGGVPKLSASAYPGVQHITKLLDVFETKADVFMVMEFGGAVLSKALFDIKGEFVARGSFQPRERVYRVHHLPFYEAMKRDPRVLQRVLRQVLQAIRALADLSIVHSDLKPDNLLIEVVEGQELACQVRLCDFGSSFLFHRPEQLALATPEYMPPEALESCLCRGGEAAAATMAMHARARPWSFDVWSLGSIMLELGYGVPHWLSYKCRVRGIDGAKDHSVTGIFAVPGRDHERILQRQQEMVMDGGLRRVLRDSPGVPLDARGLELLEAMLAWDAESRCSPADALAHPFLTSA